MTTQSKVVFSRFRHGFRVHVRQPGSSTAICGASPAKGRGSIGRLLKMIVDVTPDEDTKWCRKCKEQHDAAKRSPKPAWPPRFGLVLCKYEEEADDDDCPLYLHATDPHNWTADVTVAAVFRTLEEARARRDKEAEDEELEDSDSEIFFEQVTQWSNEPPYRACGTGPYSESRQGKP